MATRRALSKALTTYISDLSDHNGLGSNYGYPIVVSFTSHIDVQLVCASNEMQTRIQNHVEKSKDFQPLIESFAHTELINVQLTDAIRKADEWLQATSLRAKFLQTKTEPRKAKLFEQLQNLHSNPFLSRTAVRQVIKFRRGLPEMEEVLFVNNFADASYLPFVNDFLGLLIQPKQLQLAWNVTLPSYKLAGLNLGDWSRRESHARQRVTRPQKLKTLLDESIDAMLDALEAASKPAHEIRELLPLKKSVVEKHEKKELLSEPQDEPLADEIPADEIPADETPADQPPAYEPPAYEQPDAQVHNFGTEIQTDS